MKITLIGLGIMGTGMAQNLLKKHGPITVFNRNPAAAEALEPLGAQVALSVPDAVRDADLVLTMVANPQAVEQIMLGENGGLAHMKRGAIWVDSTTVDPVFSQKCNLAAEQSGIRFADAPVTGTKPHALGGELSFFAGGTPELLEEIKPILLLMGARVLHLGPVTTGASYKILLNLMLAQSMVVFSEAVLLGEKLGFDRTFLLENLPKAPVIAPFTQAKAQMMVAGDESVHFPLELMLKDVHLATQLAYEKGQPMYLAGITESLYAGANQEGLSRTDFSAIFKWLSKG
ncbi:MAG TPA: NAD(P)-dependent oxidoreductase [Saprospiraceae bacterium]|nr:NAD(P)-dependent oxidoreductase [Saprospiraceae bacterium]HPG08111.1 NAD(P)-dependent oxidoreductase [Saprospiraceae bacterium]HRV85967.1 NAD(P)-dependent oxidoreductase [Saprospiraceae bacterium]